jgi:hypothetical protein
MSVNVVDLAKSKPAKSATKKPAAKKATRSKAVKAISKLPIAIYPMAAMTIVLLLVSLPDQVAGLSIVTHCSETQAWLIALALDGLTVSTEFSAQTAGVEKREFKAVCWLLLGISLTLSGFLNIQALGGFTNYASIWIGAAIPAALALATVAIGLMKPSK